MNHKKYSVVILAIALIIIANRGLCMAHFSQRAAVQESEIRVAIPGNRSTERDVSHLVAERIGREFTGRVKKYIYAPPAFQYVGSQPTTTRGSYERSFITIPVDIPPGSLCLCDENCRR